MKKKHIRDTPVIKVTEGYDLESVALGNEGLYHLKHRRFNLDRSARKTRLSVARGIHACFCFSDHPQRRHDDTRIYEICRAVLFDGTAVL